MQLREPSLCNVILSTSGSGNTGVAVNTTHAAKLEPVHAAAEMVQALDAADSAENCFIGMFEAVAVKAR